MDRKRQQKGAADDLDLSSPVELVVLAVKERAAPCLLLGTSRNITLRASGLWDVVPGLFFPDNACNALFGIENGLGLYPAIAFYFYSFQRASCLVVI